jgi:hypothetical protein
MRNVVLLIIDNRLQQIMIRVPSGASGVIDDVKGHVNRTWYTTSGAPANQLRVSGYLCVCENKIQAGRKSLP